MKLAGRGVGVRKPSYPAAVVARTLRIHPHAAPRGEHMHYRPLLILVFLPGLLVGQGPPSAPGSDRWIVEQFFFAADWPTRAQYYSGEMKRLYLNTQTMGEAGAPALRGSLRLIKAAEREAVYAVRIGAPERIEDWYAYLVKGDSGCRLSAVRALALPPLFFILLDSLSLMKPLPDSLLSTVENMRLAASSDSALKQFFLAHAEAIQRIADGFSHETAGSIAAAPDGLQAPTPSLQSLARQLAALHLRGAWRDSEVPDCLFVEIGGMIDNEVGFMRCATERSVPAITPERFILIESLSGGWHLYKTT
jgi:hypothetical protein